VLENIGGLVGASDVRNDFGSRGVSVVCEIELATRRSSGATR
jgi:hypothetical protein